MVNEHYGNGDMKYLRGASRLLSRKPANEYCLRLSKKVLYTIIDKGATKLSVFLVYGFPG